MTDKPQFAVDPEADLLTSDPVETPPDILRIIPPENKDSVAKQLVDNLRLNVSTTEVKLTTSAKY